MLNRSVFFLIAALVALSSLSQAQTSAGASSADTQQGIDCTDPVNAGAASCQLGYGQNGQQPGYSGQQNPTGATQTGRTGANGLQNGPTYVDNGGAVRNPNNLGHPIPTPPEALTAV